MKLQRKIVAWVAGAVLLLLALLGAYRWAERSHRLVEIINSGHHLALAIKIHISDTGRFPDDLNALVREGDLPVDFRRWFGTDVQIDYLKPRDGSGTNTLVLVLYWSGYKITYNKDLERKVERDRT